MNPESDPRSGAGFTYTMTSFPGFTGDYLLSRQQVLDHIAEEFPVEPRPSTQELGFDHWDDEFGFLMNRFDKYGRCYTDVSYSEISRHSDQILLLNGVAFKYYLPCYLHACLKPPEEAQKYGDFLESVLWKLSYGKKHGEVHRECLEILEVGQLKCVVRFLIFITKHGPTENFRREAASALNSWGP